MTDVIIVRQNKDLKLDNALTIGTNDSVPIPGTIRYNSDTDNFEGYTDNTNPYNSSKWALMSLNVASASNLGGIKIGNNLSITTGGILNAVSESVSRKFQKTLIVSLPENSGDYTSINQCIEYFFGYDSGTGTFPDGELANLDKTDYPDPDINNRYIILVSPGVYEETSRITLPPYTVLIGDNRDGCIINIDDDTAIECDENCYIGNLTINLTNANNGTSTSATGININNKNNVKIENVLLRLETQEKDTKFINVIDSNSLELSNIESSLSITAEPLTFTTQELKLINTNNSSVNINNCILNVNSLRVHKSIISAINKSDITVNNSYFNINEINNSSASHYNKCIYLENSEFNSKNTTIKINGYDLLIEDDTHRNIGIEFKSDTYSQSTTETDIIFVHYEDNSQYDEILVPSSSTDFSSIFGIGDYIKTSGATETENNNIFKIRNIYSADLNLTGSLINYSIIQLDYSAILLDEVISSGSILIKKLYNIELFTTLIESTNETIKSISTDAGHLDNYRIKLAKTNLEGYNINAGQNRLIFNTPHLITVGRQNSDFNNIKSAVNSILDSSEDNPYIIQVSPGNYVESGQINLPSYTTLKGDSNKGVLIDFDIIDNNNYYPLNSAILLADNTKLENIKLSLSSNLDPTLISSNNYPTILISTNNLSNTVIDNTITDGSVGDYLSNIKFENIDINLSPTINNSNTYGMFMYKSHYEIDGIKITDTAKDLSGTQQFNYAIRNTLSNATINSAVIDMSGSENNSNSYAMYNDRAIINLNTPKINVYQDAVSGDNNHAIFATNIDNKDDSVLLVSGYTNLIFGGETRARGGNRNKSLFVDYNSTIIAVSLLLEGDTHTYNNALNQVPNSFLKTVNSFFISGENGILNNITSADQRGYPVIANDNLFVGDPAGALGTQGQRNLAVGIRTGIYNTQGYQNTLLGIDAGKMIESSNSSTMIGYAAGKESLGANNTLIGSQTANNMVNGSDNTIIGYNSANVANNINNMTIVGSNTGINVQSSSNIILIGNNNSQHLVAVHNDLIIGNNTGKSLAIGDNNLLIGNNTANKLIQNNFNISIGNNSLTNMENGANNIVMGYDAGLNLVTSVKNVIIGQHAGKAQPGGLTYNNVMIGYNTGNQINNANTNVLIGSNAGVNLNDGSRNIIIGNESEEKTDSSPGNALTDGNDNIVMGNNTAVNLTTGSRNIILGNENGNSLDGTSDTIIIGYNSGGNISGSNDQDNQNIIIGNEAGKLTTSGKAVIIGHEAGKFSQGDDVLIIGNQAGKVVNGSRNTILGNYAAGISDNANTNAVLGHDNTLIGTFSGFSLETGSYNVMIGSGNSSGGTGHSIVGGDGNMLFGYKSGRNLINGNYNVFIGKESGYLMKQSNRNIMIGHGAGFNLGSLEANIGLSNNNLLIGNEAGYNYIEGSQLLFIGYRAGYNSTNGDDNTFIGNYAGFRNQNQGQNTYIGNYAGYDNESAQNTMIGVNSGKYSTGDRNTYIGFEAGLGNNTYKNEGQKNTFIGFQAGGTVRTGDENIYIGDEAGKNNDDGSKNIMIGAKAGNESSTNKSIFIGSTDDSETSVGKNTTGDYNIFIGTDTGLNNVQGEENIFMGSHAGKYNTTGNASILIGDDAGLNNTTGDRNIMIGKLAGRDNSTGTQNIIIGSEAGKVSGSDKSNNILIGAQSGLYNNVDNSIFIGQEAGKMNSNGIGNILVGKNAGKNFTQSHNNIMIGSNSGANFNRLTDNKGDNIFIGAESGKQNQSGTENIIIGSEVFENSTQGSGVIAIGYRAGRNAGVLEENVEGQTYNNVLIGYNAASEGDIKLNNIVIGAETAKNVNNPRTFENNSFLGADSGKNANLSTNSIVLGSANKIGTGGDGNIISGQNAGNNLGNPFPYTLTTIQEISNGALSVIVNNSLALVNTYFEEGDKILIENSSRTIYHITEIASLLPDSTATPPESRTKVVFTSKFSPSTITDTLVVGSSVYSLAKISDNVGQADDSRYSANTLMGTSTALNLTKGSKNVALGPNAMYRNTIGKYNNILGTNAGYNLRSDNNTCFGTDAGKSLDLYTYTNNTNGTDLQFISNTNTINSTNTDLSSFNFGDVFEVDGSSGNDGRYFVSAGNENKIIIQGYPIISRVGIPDNVSSEDLKINSGTFNFNNFSFNAEGLKTDFNIISSNQYNGLMTVNGISDTSNIAKINNLNNYCGIFKISGSKYNDGIYYIDTSVSSLIKNEMVIGFYNFYTEIFDSNVIISSISIHTDNITTGTTFNDFNKNSSFYVFFGINNGIYNTNNETKKLNILRRNNNSILLNDNDIIETNNNDENVIFTKGLTYTISNIESNNILNNSKVSIGGNISFYSSNNTIIFDDYHFEGLTNSASPTLNNSYYIIKSNTSFLNNGKLIKIDTNVSTKFIINSDYPLTDETIHFTGSNCLIFEQSYLNLNNMLDESEYVEGRIINLNLNDNLKTNSKSGKFIIKKIINNTSNTYILLDNSILASNVYITDLNITDIDAEFKINLDNYKIDSDYLSENNKINGFDFIFQNEIYNSITGTYSLNSSNNTITTPTKYEFSKIVSPAICKIGANYYYIKRNKYPFQELEIDENLTNITTDSTTSNLIVKCVSKINNTSNLANMMNIGTEYTIIGNQKNNLVKITPEHIIDNAIYVDENSNIINERGNRVIAFSVNNNYDTNTDSGIIRGKFKHIEFKENNFDILYNNQYNSYYEPILYLEVSDNIPNKRFLFKPYIESSLKYCYNVLNNTTFEDTSSEAQNTTNTTLSLLNNFTIFGKSVNELKINDPGYLSFNDGENIYYLHYLNGNINKRFANPSSYYKYKHITTYHPYDTFLIELYLYDLSYGDITNLQIKLFLNNAQEHKIGDIEINFSDDISAVGIQMAIGLESPLSSNKETKLINYDFQYYYSNNTNIITPYRVNNYEITYINYSINQTYNNYSYDYTNLSNIGPVMTSYNLSYHFMSMYESTLVVGDPNKTVSGNTFAGEVFIYKYDLSNISNPTLLLNTDATANTDVQSSALFGYSTSIYNDNIVIGAPGYTEGSNSSAGRVYLYSKTSGNWSFNTTIINPSASADEQFGYIVSISDDLVAIGAPATNSIVALGKVYIYKISSDTIVQIIDGENVEDGFGYVLKLYKNYLAIGAPYYNYNTDYGYTVNSAGKVYFYNTIDNTTFSLYGNIFNGSKPTNDNFGYNLDMNNSILVISSKILSANNWGKVNYIKLEEIIEGNNNLYSFISNGTNGYYDFGNSLSINNTEVIIGTGDYEFDLGSGNSSIYFIYKIKDILNYNSSDRITINYIGGRCSATYNNFTVFSNYDSSTIFSPPIDYTFIPNQYDTSYYPTYNISKYIPHTDKHFTNYKSLYTLATSNTINLPSSIISSNISINNSSYSNTDIFISKKGYVLFTNQYSTDIFHYSNDDNITSNLYYYSNGERLSIIKEYNNTTSNTIIQTDFYYDTSIFKKQINYFVQSLDYLENVSGVNSNIYFGITNPVYNTSNSLSENHLNSASTDTITLKFNESSNIINYEGQFINNMIFKSNINSNDGLYELKGTESNINGTFYISAYHNPLIIDEELLNQSNINIRINNFISNYKEIDYYVNFKDVWDNFGENVNYIRFNICNNFDNVYESISSNEKLYERSANKSLNYTIDSWENSNITSNNVIYIKETVPNDINEYDNTNYLLSFGTPTLNPTNDSNIEIENINIEPIGVFEQYLIDKTFLYSDKLTIFENESISGTIEINSSTNRLILNNLVYSGEVSYDGEFYTIDILNKSYTDNNQFYDYYNKPFANLKPGMFIKVLIRTNSPFSQTNITLQIKKVISDFEVELDDRFFINDYSLFNFNHLDYIKITIDTDLYSFITVNSCTHISGQIITDRLDFSKFNTIFNYNEAIGFIQNNISTKNNFISLIDLPLIYKNSTKDNNFYTSFYNNLKLPLNTLRPLTSNISFYTNTGYNSCLDFGINPKFNYNSFTSSNIELMNYPYKQTYLQTFDHTLLIPTSNLVALGSISDIIFSNISTTSTINFNIDSGTGIHSIDYSSGDKFDDYLANQIIKVSNSIDNDGYYKISSLSNTQIIIDTTYSNLSLDVNGVVGVIIDTNTINSTTTDLSVYKPGQKIIVSKTTNNNGPLNIHDDILTTTNSLYIQESLTYETPIYTRIEKSMFVDETSQIQGSSDISFNYNVSNPTNSYITTSSGTDNFLGFVPNQQIVITGAGNASNNDTFTIRNEEPTNDTIPVNIQATELNTSALISKLITLVKLGEAVVTTSSDGIVKFHYQDAQGNNVMIGSFTGQFAGANALSIHNLYLGNKVGQTNQGSGNVFFGNETGFATSFTDGATSYNNKLAIYKQNFIGVPSNPLIGGDFGSNRVGINTINPDSLLSGTLDSGTRLVVNGAVRASAHSTFTGTHIINLTSDLMRELNKLKPGLIMTSSGNVTKKGIIDTIVECKLANKNNDKCVYGIYSHHDIGLSDDDVLYYCASVGEGQILVTNINGEVNNGDYITTSEIEGYGRLQDDDILHSYTVAKCTEFIDWNNINNYIVGKDGKQYKYYLTGCTYHCG
jgi:hypothetical protein